MCFPSFAGDHFEFHHYHHNDADHVLGGPTNGGHSFQRVN